MKCPQCIAEGKKSTVSSDGSMSTLMGFMTWCDEDGNTHQHDRNKVTTGYKCSNGHVFVSVRNGSPCPSYPNNCDFDGGMEEIKIIK